MLPILYIIFVISLNLLSEAINASKWVMTDRMKIQWKSVRLSKSERHLSKSFHNDQLKYICTFLNFSLFSYLKSCSLGERTKVFQTHLNETTIITYVWIKSQISLKESKCWNKYETIQHSWKTQIFRITLALILIFISQDGGPKIK